MKVDVVCRVEKVVEVEVSDILDGLRKHLGVDNYKIIDSELHEYQRVSWNDYDYVKVEGDKSLILKKLEVLVELESLLSPKEKVSKFKNMKIPVENNLDEIVAELLKRGYTLDFDISNGNPTFIYTGHLGDFFIHNEDLETKPKSDVTLAELKEM